MKALIRGRGSIRLNGIQWEQHCPFLQPNKTVIQTLIKAQENLKNNNNSNQCSGLRRYLFPGGLVLAHVLLQLRAVGEGVAALGAAEVVLALLVPILDVVLQRGIALVATRAVRAGVKLGEGIWCAWD